MEDKRKRTGNFTSDEKSVLTKLVIKYRDVIENKKTDATTNAEKARGWKSLSEEFNARSTHSMRNPESLKTCWENIKRQTKKQSASRKRELFKTGGGPPPPPPPPSTEADGMIENILGPALEGLENVYDSDALQYINDTDKDAENSAVDFNTQVDYETLESEKVDILVLDNEPSCLSTVSVAEISLEKKDNNLKWQGYTPQSLKRPISEALRSNGENKENNSWLKRRRPDHRNLSDQLILEKIDLVRTLKENALEESKKRMLILEEQLKQEKIKTQKLL